MGHRRQRSVIVTLVTLTLAGACGSGTGGRVPDAASGSGSDGAQPPRSGSHVVDGGGDAAGPPQVVLAQYGRPGDCPVWDPAGAHRLPRNVILVVGDGMGPEQVASARFAAGGSLRMDELDHHAFLVTDSATTLRDGAPTDSASAATAMATGVPVANGQLGASADGERLPTALDIAQRAGRATGLVTSSYLHDATPMAFAVRVESRSSTTEIQTQLLMRTPIEVLMGGGAAWLAPGAEVWPQRAQGEGYSVVTNAAELEALPVDTTPVLGLFTAQLSDPPTAIGWQMTPAHRRGLGELDPSLAEMTRAALERLALDADGMFLLVEDEATDEIGHLSEAYPAMSRDAIAGEVRYLDEAIGAVIDWVLAHDGFTETLVVVTADHETGGYVHDRQRPGGGDYTQTSHTRTPVDVFARGPGAEGVPEMCWLGDVFQLMTGLR